MSALIGAVGSVLGGLFGKGKKVKASDNSYGHVKGIMRAAETFGFNPLTLLGSVNAVGGTAADNSAFGQGIANAAMIWSDSLAARASEKAKLNQYQMQNDMLQERVTALTLRPPVPGIFGGAPYAADSSNSGGLSGVGAVRGPAGAPGDITPYPADERRDQEVMPITNDGGVGVIDNPNLNRPFPVPMVNGEILDMGQSIVLGASLLYDRAKQRREQRAKPNMTFGKPLRIPPSWAGSGRTGELLPRAYTNRKYKQPHYFNPYNSGWVQ